MVAVLLITNLLATLPTPLPGGCEGLPSPLRVRITIGPTGWKDAEPTIRRLVEET